MFNIKINPNSQISVYHYQCQYKTIHVTCPSAARATQKQGQGVGLARVRTNAMVADQDAPEAPDAARGITDTVKTANGQAPQGVTTVHMEMQEDMWIVTADTYVPPPPHLGAARHDTGHVGHDRAEGEQCKANGG